MVNLQSVTSMVNQVFKLLDSLLIHLHMTCLVFQETSEKKVFTDLISYSLFIIAISGRFYEIFLLVFLNTYACLKMFRFLLTIFNTLLSTVFSVRQTYRLNWQSLTWKSKMSFIESFILKEHPIHHFCLAFLSYVISD